MMERFDLSGAWELLPVAQFDGKYEGRNWLAAQVPGHVQQVAGLEGYAGKVVYRKRFDFSPRPGRRYFLRLNGAFYWSIAYLNGTRLGANEGYFFPVEYEITSLLRGQNELLVELDCPDEPDQENKRQITGVFHHWDSIDPAANPGGLWLPVEVIATGEARIQSAAGTVLYLEDRAKSARLSARVTLDTPGPAGLDLRVSFIPRTFEGEPVVFTRRVSKAGGLNTYQYELTLPDPRLWWTWDQGRPDLYTLRVEALAPGAAEPSDVWEAAFGIRTIEMRDYICRLNGRRIYLRGNNYPPGDTRLATMTRERADRDVALARECNLNLLRVHAHVDHPAFYDACDAAGMLLWQDFPLQWRYQPLIQAQAVRQVEKMIALLRNHPSIAVWCMHNEPIRMYDSRKIPGAGALARFLFSLLVWNCNRDRMDLALAARARFLNPHRFITRCSGERGLGRRPGDIHSYFGWYFGPLRWLHKTYTHHPDHLRFVTEFGAQSLPNRESAVRFMDPDIRKIDWRTLKARHSYQPFFMKFFANPKRFPDLASFITATQDHQAEVNHYYIDRIRARKFKPGGGVVAFSFHDANPAITWSIVDYWRVPKSSYAEMKKAMSPVAAFAIPDRGCYRRGDVARIAVHAVNDTPTSAPVKVVVRIVSPVGETIVDETREAELAADAPALVLMNPEVRLRWEGEYRVELELTGPDGPLRRDYRIQVG